MSTNAAIPEHNTTSAPILEAPLPQEVLRDLYKDMLRARLLRQRLREGTSICEAIVSGSLQNAVPTDVIVSAENNPVLDVVSGAELEKFLAKNGEAPSIAERRVIVAETMSFAGVAAGVAIAAVRNRSDAVVLAFAQGKATRGAAFAEATEFAAKNRLPIIFLADWTTARASSRNHDGRELSHWPLPTIAVDGRDVIAVYRVTKEAIGAARRGHGPTLVDCVNFLAPCGRGRDERDPLAAYRGYLQRHNAWSDVWYTELLARQKEEVGIPAKSRTGGK